MVGRRGYRIIAKRKKRRKNLIRLDCRLAVSRGRDEGKFAENPGESCNRRKRRGRRRKEESEREREREREKVRNEERKISKC